MRILIALAESPVFLAIVLSVTAAQLSKILLIVYKQKHKFVWEDILVTGNMPSAHAAIVTALATIILLTEGASPLFFMAFVFAAIVIRDAVGVRRTVGEESKVLTNIIHALKNRFHITIPRKMHESIGHQPIEVFVGVMIGILSAVLVHML